MTAISSKVRRRYSFGPYTLDPDRRLVWRGGTLVALTPKTVEVLSALVEHHGEVVQKDELLRFVWPNTVVEENNLARHISTLRKALQQRRGQHDFISTIPGRGYMFVAAVTELDETPLPIDVRSLDPGGEVRSTDGPAAQVLLDDAPPLFSSRRIRILALAATVALVLASAALVRSLNRGDGSGSPLTTELKQLTFDPGIQRDPTWSPDGGWLAYAADRDGNLDIYRRSLSDPAPIRLTNDLADESQPDWSPDGQWIAFRSEREGGGVYVMPAAGGHARRLTPFGFFPRWSPDGSRLLIRGSMLRGIDSTAFVVQPDGSGLAQVRPDLLRQFRAPHVGWFADGKRVSIAGRRIKADWAFVTAAIDGNASLESAAAAGHALELSRQDVSLGRFVWSKSGRFLYFEGRSSDAQSLWRIEVDPRSLAWSSPPERVSTSPAEYTDLALSSDAKRLAFTVRQDRTRVWSFPFSPALGALTGEGRPVTPGGPGEYDAAAPLDGSKVAYRTVRGGRQELWQRSSSGDDELLLASSATATRSSPRWSRDGTRLAYQRSNRADGAGRGGRAVAIMPAGGGAERLLNLPPETEVVPDDWSSDGSWILAACRRAPTQPMGTCLIPSGSNAISDLRVVAADPLRSLLCQRFSPDERWISFMAVDAGRRDVSTIYVMPRAGGEWVAVTDGESYDDKPRWSPDGRALYFLSARDGSLNLWGRRFDPETGTVVGAPYRVTSFRGSGPAMARELGRVEIAISSDRVFLPITESAGTIWMLEGVDR